MTKNCLVCNNEFMLYPSYLKKGGGKFCSRKCYGRWASKNMQGEKAKAWKGGKMVRTCISCKKGFKKHPSRLKDGKGIFCSKKCRGLWIKKYQSGKNSPNWKDGSTPINKIIRHSLEYRLWRIAVFERDNFTCIWCGARNYEGQGKTVKLHADHIKPFAKYPELRFAIDNGRTLCIDCHKTTDTFGGKMHKIIYE